VRAALPKPPTRAVSETIAPAVSETIAPAQEVVPVAENTIETPPDIAVPQDATLIGPEATGPLDMISQEVVSSSNEANDVITRLRQMPAEEVESADPESLLADEPASSVLALFKGLGSTVEAQPVEQNESFGDYLERTGTSIYDFDTRPTVYDEAGKVYVPQGADPFESIMELATGKRELADIAAPPSQESAPTITKEEATRQREAKATEDFYADNKKDAAVEPESTNTQAPIETENLEVKFAGAKGVISKKALPVVEAPTGELDSDGRPITKLAPGFVNDADVLAEVLNTTMGANRVYIPKSELDNINFDNIGVAYEKDTGRAYVTFARHSRYSGAPILDSGLTEDGASLADLYKNDDGRKRNSEAQTKGNKAKNKAKNAGVSVDEVVIPAMQPAYAEKVYKAPESKFEIENPERVKKDIAKINEKAQLLASETITTEDGQLITIGAELADRIAQAAVVTYIARHRGLDKGKFKDPTGVISDIKKKVIPYLKKRPGTGAGFSLDQTVADTGTTMGDLVADSNAVDPTAEANETEQADTQASLDSEEPPAPENSVQPEVNKETGKQGDMIETAMAEVEAELLESSPADYNIWKSTEQMILGGKDVKSLTASRKRVVEFVKKRAREKLQQAVATERWVNTDKATSSLSADSTQARDFDQEALEDTVTRNFNKVIELNGGPKTGGFNVRDMLREIAVDSGTMQQLGIGDGLITPPLVRLFANYLANSKHDFSGVEFEIVRDSKNKNNWAGQYTGGTKANGGMIQINLASLHRGGVATTIVHEALHHIVLYKLRPEYAREGVEVTAFRDLNKILTHIRKKVLAPKKGESLSRAAQRQISGDNVFYGLSNIDELFTETLTNTRFAAWLQSQEAIPGLTPKNTGVFRSLYEQVKQIFKNLIGATNVRPDSILSQAMDNIMALAETPQSDAKINEWFVGEIDRWFDGGKDGRNLSAEAKGKAKAKTVKPEVVKIKLNHAYWVTPDGLVIDVESEGWNESESAYSHGRFIKNWLDFRLNKFHPDKLEIGKATIIKARAKELLRDTPFIGKETDEDGNPNPFAGDLAYNQAAQEMGWVRIKPGSSPTTRTIYAESKGNPSSAVKRILDDLEQSEGYEVINLTGGAIEQRTSYNRPTMTMMFRQMEGQAPKIFSAKAKGKTKGPVLTEANIAANRVKKSSNYWITPNGDVIDVLEEGLAQAGDGKPVVTHGRYIKKWIADKLKRSETDKQKTFAAIELQSKVNEILSENPSLKGEIDYEQLQQEYETEVTLAETLDYDPPDYDSFIKDAEENIGPSPIVYVQAAEELGWARIRGEGLHRVGGQRYVETYGPSLGIKAKAVIKYLTGYIVTENGAMARNTAPRPTQMLAFRELYGRNEGFMAEAVDPNKAVFDEEVSRADAMVRDSFSSQNIQLRQEVDTAGHPAWAMMDGGTPVIGYDPQWVAVEIAGLNDADAKALVVKMLRHEELHIAALASDLTTPDSEGRVGEEKAIAFYDEVMTPQQRRETAERYLRRFEGQTEEQYQQTINDFLEQKYNVVGEFKRMYAERYLTGKTYENLANELANASDNKLVRILQEVSNYIQAKVRLINARLQVAFDPKLAAELSENLAYMDILSRVSGIAPEATQSPAAFKAPHVLHNVRYVEDISAILNGLRSGTNVTIDSTKPNQSIGAGGVTLVIDPQSIAYKPKEYNSNEGVALKTSRPRVVEILVDKDGYGQSGVTQGDIDKAQDKMLERLPQLESAWEQAKANYSAVRSRVDASAANTGRVSQELAQELKAAERKSAQAERAYWQETRALEMSPQPSIRAEDAIREELSELIGNYPVYSYDTDENGDAVNFQKIEATQSPAADPVKQQAFYSYGGEKADAPQSPAADPVKRHLETAGREKSKYGLFELAPEAKGIIGLVQDLNAQDVLNYFEKHGVDWAKQRKVLSDSITIDGKRYLPEWYDPKPEEDVKGWKKRIDMRDLRDELDTRTRIEDPETGMFKAQGLSFEKRIYRDLGFDPINSEFKIEATQSPAADAPQTSAKALFASRAQRRKMIEESAGWKVSGPFGQGLMDMRVHNQIARKDAQIRGAAFRVSETAKKFERLVSKHKPAQQNLQDALGTTDNTLTEAQDRQVKALQRKVRAETDPVLRQVAIANTDAYRLKEIKANNKTREAVRRAALASLPQELADVVTDMRSQIDTLSRELVYKGMVSDNLKATIGANLGLYLNRSYEIFDNREWADHISKDTSAESVKIRNDALKIFRAQLEATEAARIRRAAKEAGLPVPSKSDALLTAKSTVTQNDVDILMNDYLRVGDDKSVAMLGGVLPGKKDVSILKVRGQIPAEIRALWGEYKAPEVSYAKTYINLASFIANHSFQQELLDTGLNGAQPFLWKDGVSSGARPAHWVSVFPEGASSSPNPMGGVYGPEIIKEAFIELSKTYKKNIVQEALSTLTGLSMASKTVYNMPQANVRNFLGNGLIIAGNGYLATDLLKLGFFKRLAGAANNVGPNLVGLAPERSVAVTSYVERLIKNGVVNDNVKANVVKELTAVIFDRNPSKAFGGVISKKAMDAAKGLNDRLVGAYSAGDDFWKIVAFESERSTMQKAFPSATEESLDRMAAERVRNVLPTYSQIPKVVNDLFKSHPYFAPFISWTSEIIRTSANTVKVGWADARSGNPALQKSGIIRLASFAAAQAALPALALVVRNAVGLDDEDEEALRRFLPSWQVDGLLLMTGKLEDGKASFWDLSYLNPYSSIQNPFIVAKQELDKGGGVGSAAWEFAKKAAEPWTAEQLLAGAVISAIRGVDKNGRPVFNEADTTWNKTLARASLVVDSLSPGSFNIGSRIYKAATGQMRGDGKVYQLQNEIVGPLIGQRMAEIDSLQNFQQGKVPQYKHMASQAGLLATQAYRFRGTPDLQKIKDNYAQSNNARMEAIKSLRKDYLALKTLGVTEDKIVRALVAAKVEKDDIGQVKSGVFIKSIPSKVTFENAVGLPEFPKRLQALKDAIHEYPSRQSLDD